MMSKYFKNFILCGDVDHYCLLCQETFRSTTDVEKHIRWEKHRKNIKNQACLPRFKKDSIYKIGNYYYCEVCNYVTQNIVTIQDHLNEDTHATNKNSPVTITKQTIGHYDSGFVKIHNVLVDNLQWHGIIKNHCIICKIAVENISKHITMEDHLIQLIQIETKFENDGKLYRKINENTYQCFACEKAIQTDFFNDHWSKKHLNINEVDTKQVYEGGKKKESHNDSKDKLNINLVTTYKFFTIDVKVRKATCKACNHALAFNFTDMKDHIMKEHIKIIQNPSIMKEIIGDATLNESSEKEVIYMPCKDHGMRRSELSKYGKENFIKMNAGGSKGYCTMCDKVLSAHMNIFKQHVEGGNHTGHLELKGLYKNRSHEKGKYRTESVNSYLENILYSQDMKAFWINVDFCIDYDSFIFLKIVENGPHYKKIKCHACDMMLTKGSGKDHCKTNQHKNNVMTAKVILEEDEFTREIHPNLYHCGFCNLTFPYWETLKKHRKTLNHEITRHNKSIVASVAEFWHYNNQSPDPKNTVHITRTSNSDILYLQFMKAIFGKF